MSHSPLHWGRPLVMLSMAEVPASIFLGFRPWRVVLVGFVVMFLISLAGFLLYIFSLPSDHDGH